MSRFNYSLPNSIEIPEPAIRSCLIADLPPDALLRVQSGLVAGQVSQTQSSIRTKELLDLIAHVPSGSIYIQPDRVTRQPSAEQCQALQKFFPVTGRCPHQPRASQHGRYPAKDIQPLTMLAGRRNPKPLPSLSPSHTQARMQAEAGFVFKDHCFPRPQVPEFFLTPSETSSHLLLVLECRNSWPVSADNPIDASNSEPAAPSALSRTAAAGAAPASAHPTGRGSIPALMAPSPNLLPPAYGALRSSVPVGPADPSASMPQAPLCSPYASTDSSFDASDPRHRLSIPDAGPPTPATEPRPLSLRVPPECPKQRPQDALGLPPDALVLNLDFSCCLLTAA